MDKLNQLKPPEPTKKSKTTLLAILLALATLCVIGLAIALWWCLWAYKPSGGASTTPPASMGSGTTTAAAGPCYDGAANELPAGYSWYENADLGYKFAYPTAWGAVAVATTPMGGDAGHYVQGSFTSNANVSFGGNGTDYVVLARGGTHTDNPGYLEATGKFYAVQLWKLREGATATPMEDLHPIEEPTVRKNGCNTRAAVTQYPFEEFYGEAYDIARINLQPSNLYYGVNFVLKNPTAEARADLDKIIRSFQLIP